VLASAHEDAEGLIQKVTLLEGKLAEVRQTREVAEEKFRSFPFCELRAPSCVLPLLTRHERGITCWRGCRPLPSAILKWSGSLSCFER
jgi:hypothetical protein